MRGTGRQELSLELTMQGIGKYCMILTLLSGEHLAGRPQSSRFLSSLLLVIVVVVVNRWK